MSDLRYGLRALRNDPRFTLLATAALALGIGATTVIFSVIHAVLLHPFPYVDSDRLVSFFVSDVKGGGKGGRNYFLGPEFRQYQEQNRSFDQVIGIDSTDVILTGAGDPEHIRAGFVTANTFSVLGVAPLIGRAIGGDDGKPGASPVAVLSYPVFRRRFGGDPRIVGRTITLNYRPTTVIGVMPPRFAWWERDVWLSAVMIEAGEQNNRIPIFYLWGRLKPGVTKAQAAGDFQALVERMAVEHKDYPRQPLVYVQTLAEYAVGQFRRTLYTLLAAVGMLLLIACGNVGNLLLAKATAREKEIVIRLALGASRARLARQLLVESLLLALLGAVGGCVLAAVGIKTLVPLIPSNTVPSGAVIGLNGSVLLATLAIAFFSSLVFGLAPALHSARVELNPSLKGAKSGRGRLRNLLVVGEVALSLTLLVGAGLLIRTFFALRQVTLGFEPDHVLTMAIPLPDGRYAKAGQKARFFRDLMARVEALPGVVSAAETSSLPPYGGIPSALEIGGKARENGRDALFHLISERYFETLRVRLLRGRNFTAEEVSVGRKVAVISETFARENFGSENPLGRQLKFTFLEQMPNPVKDPWFQIVGVVADVKNQGLQQPARAAAYVPYTVTGFGGRGILVRAVGNPKALLSAVRHEITAIDSNLAPDSSGLGQPAAMRDLLTSFSLSQPRFTLILLSLFGAVGLTLVSIGIYGVVSYTVSRRTHEIGIRIALGAQGAHVIRIVLNSGMRLVALGTVAGLALSFAVVKLLGSQIWGVPEYDPVTLSLVVVLMMVVGIAACYSPARRASRVDPVIALRHE
jgi:putative ABC transport system permease protein